MQNIIHLRTLLIIFALFIFLTKELLVYFRQEDPKPI